MRSRIADREIALPCGHRDTRPLHLDFDLPEAPVVHVVARRVPEQVVVLQVVFDALEALAQVVRVLEEDAACLLRELAQTAAGILAQHVLVVLEALRQRVAAGVGAVSGIDAESGGLVDLVTDLGLLALGAEPGGIHRIDADVGAIGGVDDAEEQPLDGRRYRHALGKEHEALAAGEPRAASR